MGRDQAARTDHRAVEHSRMVGDHRLRTDVHAVDDTAVGDRRPWSDVDWNAWWGVQHAAVLHVRSFADDNGGEVAAEYRVEPHRGARFDANVAEQRRSGCDERSRIDRRRAALEREQRHRLDIPQVDAVYLAPLPVKTVTCSSERARTGGAT